jgi:hypothetical protein
MRTPCLISDGPPTEMERSFVNTNNIENTNELHSNPIRSDGTEIPSEARSRKRSAITSVMHNDDDDVRLWKGCEGNASDANKRLRWSECGTRRVAHFGANSAEYPATTYLNEIDLFGSAATAATREAFDPFLMGPSRLIAMHDLPPTGAAAANQFYGTYNRRGNYSSIDGNGNRVIVDSDSHTVTTVPLAVVLNHVEGDAAQGKPVTVVGDAALDAYLDGTQGVGDTRSLSGLTSIIYGPRDTLNSTLRDYYLTGSRHEGSIWGYCKMWLYVIARFQHGEQSRAAGDPAFALALAPGFAQPLVDDPAVARANFDANNIGINNDTVGWFFAPRETEDVVLSAMSDFFRPFPSCQWQNANYKTAAWRNVIPGVEITVANVPGRNLGYVVPARAALPTTGEYMQAIRLLASFRMEDADCISGLGLAAQLASGVRTDLAAIGTAIPAEIRASGHAER